MVATAVTIADVARIWGAVVIFAAGLAVLAKAPLVGPAIRWLWATLVAEPMVRAFDRGVDRHLDPIRSDVQVIGERSKQLEPNGGSSLYDRVGKLEKGQANAMRQQERFTKKLTPMVETIASLAGPPRRTAPLKKKETR